MTIYFSPAARTASQRMPTPLCVETCRWICYNELDLPASDTPGISGNVGIAGLSQPLYWRRMTKKKDWTRDPFTVGRDDPDAADNWFAVYRRITTDECINYEASRDSVMVVNFYDNRDAARRLPGVVN